MLRLRLNNRNHTIFMMMVLCSLSIIPSTLLASEIATSQQFNVIKEAIFHHAYPTRPTYQVTRKLFGKSNNSQDNKLLNAAKRTLTDSRDLIQFPDKQKLLQANGICFTGTWKIDEGNDKNIFTGLFSPGTSQSVIVRASVALSGTKQKNKRAFGMAIKFFPDDLTTSTSLNAFLLHSFGGVITKHVLDLSLDNQPTLGGLPKWSDFSTALRLKKDLEKADRLHNEQSNVKKGKKKSNFSFRPITHLNNYQDPKASNHITNIATSPKWLRLNAKTTQRIDADDFRDELAVSNYSQQQIIYSISIATATNKKSQAQWLTIGELTLNESITSAACDQRLHFQHPKLH